MPSATRRSARRRLLRLAAAALPRPRPATVAPRKLVLLRPDHIGDVLLTAPAIDLLRTSLPQAQLTYVVGPWSAEAARHGPAVDEVRTLAFPGFLRTRRPHPLQPYAILAREADRLRRENFDVAVVFRPDHWWGALLARAARIPVRVGGCTPESAPLLSHAQPRAADQHATDTALAMARLALAAVNAAPIQAPASPAFSVPASAHQAASAWWRAHGLDARRVVAVQPNAGVPLKSWPLSRWAALVDALHARDYAVVLVGAPADRPLLEAIRARLPSPARLPVAAGQALAISAAMYARCMVLVAPDSGAAHLAAAVGTPTVRLYGPASSIVFGPRPPRPDQRVLRSTGLRCAPCGHLEAPPCAAAVLPACMLEIGVAEVLDAVEAIVRHV